LIAGDWSVRISCQQGRPVLSDAMEEFEVLDYEP